MLAVTPLTTTTWPIAGDAPDLRAIVQSQAKVLTNNAALIDAYQSWLTTQQAPPNPLPTAVGNGTASGTPATTLTVSNVSGGLIIIGSVVAGAGVPTGTTISAQQSGTSGGSGVYTTSVATTAASAPLTFTPPQNASPWPTPNDALTLNTIVQNQTAIIRSQTALIQQYQDLLNTSQTVPPTTGP